MTLSLKVLGEFAVTDRAGMRLSLPTIKACGLLAYLAFSPGRSFSRQRLMTLLWSDKEERLARLSLNQALRSIRHLGAAAETTILNTDGQRVSLCVDILDSDIGRFQAALAANPAHAADL